MDMGYYQDVNGIFVHPAESEPFFNIGLFSSSEKNFPDFNPVTDIPWGEVPQNIKDIIYMPLDGFSSLSPEPFKVPFVMVSFHENMCRLYVGINVGIGQLNDSNLRCFIMGVTHPVATMISASSVCYYASYNVKYDDWYGGWEKLSPSPYGDNGYLQCYSTNSVLQDTGVSDFYFYGGNGVYYSILEYVDGSGNHLSYEIRDELSVQYNSSNTDLLCSFALSTDGFRSGRFVYGQDLAYPYCYFDYFVPPSEASLNQQLQQEQNETSKSIWETLKSVLEYIKNLPSKITEALHDWLDLIVSWLLDIYSTIRSLPNEIKQRFVELFIPSEGFFDEYTTSFQDYFRARLGILYELPDTVISILQQLVDFNPVTDGYGIDFPEVVLPVLDGGEWSDKVLIEETRIEFDFLDEGPIARLYSLYRSALWLMFVFLLINLIIRKSNKVFGGGSG